MYKTQSMSLVTGFESQSPKGDGEKTLSEAHEFENLYNAFSYNRSGMDAVFAAWAKRAFRQLIKNSVLMSGEDENTYRWSAQVTFTMSLSHLQDRVCLQRGLEGLVKALAEAVHRTSGESQLVLPGALVADISMTSADEITFRLKQKWGQK